MEVYRRRRRITFVVQLGNAAEIIRRENIGQSTFYIYGLHHYCKYFLAKWSNAYIYPAIRSGCNNTPILRAPLTISEMIKTGFFTVSPRFIYRLIFNLKSRLLHPSALAGSGNLYHHPRLPGKGMARIQSVFQERPVPESCSPDHPAWDLPVVR